MPQRLVCAVWGKAEGEGAAANTEAEEKKGDKKKEMSIWTPLSITFGAINSGSSGSNSHTLAHRELIAVILQL